MMLHRPHPACQRSGRPERAEVLHAFRRRHWQPMRPRRPLGKPLFLQGAPPRAKSSLLLRAHGWTMNSIRLGTQPKGSSRPFEAKQTSGAFEAV